MTGALYSIVHFFAANLSWWDNPVNYGLTFMCGVLILPVALLIFTRFVSYYSISVIKSVCHMANRASCSKLCKLNVIIKTKEQKKSENFCKKWKFDSLMFCFKNFVVCVYS